MSTITLFNFQQTAAAQLSDAIDEWIRVFSTRVRYWGTTPVPFVGHLKAVTGAGKTPILTKVVGDLENALVLWTSKSSAVVDQTYRNLTGKYGPLLPPHTQVIRERPSRSDWERLIEADRGITIWVTTVGSWNEAEAAEAGGSETARLNMHRPQPDWGGDKSPWEQLRTTLRRPIWVVYDESHNQTPTQLDQLTGLHPIGFLLASATPPEGQFAEYAKIVNSDDELRPIGARAHVKVSTRDVVHHQLLKHTIAIENFDSDPDALLDAAVALHKKLTDAALAAGAQVRPKALYVVEKSNPTRGEILSRPVFIWDYLVNRGVRPEEIAVYTQTKTLPDDAVRVSSLSELQPEHTHIICNRALQEGWDDPEAYIEYFDDESNSYVRIAQVIGRALRQPNAQHFDDDALNTATLFVRVPNQRFDAIVDGLKHELSLYAVDEDDPYNSSAVRVRTKRDPLPSVPVKREWEGNLSLPNYQLGQAELSDEIAKIIAMGRQRFAEEDLLAPGQRHIHKISLRGEDDDSRYEIIASSTRRKNGEYLRRRIQMRSRHCAHLLDPSIFIGEGFEQSSCAGSTAQQLLAERAEAIVRVFESTVELVPVEIEGEEFWHPGPHQPSSSAMINFRYAIHSQYSRSAFRQEELDFARALDDLGQGVWVRNPVRGGGYGIQLPMKVGDSNSFYPDFLWWVNSTCYAIDPTGQYILDAKIRGKLLQIPVPKIVLLTKGRVTSDWLNIEDRDGWTIVRARTNPAPEYVSNLRQALLRIAGVS